MLNGRVIVKAQLNDGSYWSDEMPVTYPPEAVNTVIYQALGAINKVGGLIKGSGTAVTFIPMAQVRLVTVELSDIVGANMEDVGRMLVDKG